jgi:hypothetical protein
VEEERNKPNAEEQNECVVKERNESVVQKAELVLGRKSKRDFGITAENLTVKSEIIRCSSQEKPKSNYAINPTPEQALRSNRTILPARVIAALDVLGWLEVTTMSLNNVSVSDGLF